MIYPDDTFSLVTAQFSLSYVRTGDFWQINKWSEEQRVSEVGLGFATWIIDFAQP